MYPLCQLLILFVLLFSITSCQQKLANTTTTEDSTHTASNTADKSWVSYSGTLPCADCNGIVTVLSLYQPAGPNTDLLFKLEETYKGMQSGKDVTLHSEGSYGILQGITATPNISIIQLNPEKDKALQRFFQRINNNELKMLDKDGKAFAGDLNYSLFHK